MPVTSTTRQIKYEDIIGTEVDLDSHHIICFECYDKNLYDVQGLLKRTNDGEKPKEERQIKQWSNSG